MDPLSFVLVFLVVVPFVLMHLQNKQKREKEMLELWKETNRLLAEIVNGRKS